MTFQMVNQLHETPFDRLIDKIVEVAPHFTGLDARLTESA